MTQSSSARRWSSSVIGCGRTASRLAESLRRFVGIDGYDIEQLTADLARFGFLLGVTDGEVLFGDER